LRINELAKEIGRTNKEIIEFVNKHGEEVSSHANNISVEMAAKVREAFGDKQPSKQDEGKKEDVPKKKLTAVFRPQNAQQKTSPAKPVNEDKKSSKYVNVSKKEEPAKVDEASTKQVKEMKEEKPEKPVSEAPANVVRTNEDKKDNTKSEKVSEMTNDKQSKSNNLQSNTNSNNREERKPNRDNKNFRSDRNDRNDRGERSDRSDRGERNDRGDRRQGEQRQGDRNFRSSDNRNSDNRNSDNRNFKGNRNNFSGKSGENRENRENRPFNRDNRGDNRNSEGRSFNRDNKNSEGRSFDGNRGGFNKDRGSGFNKDAFGGKDKDEAPARNQRQAPKKDNKSSGNIDGALVKKTSTTRPNKNNFKDQKNDKRHRTEDGPTKGGKVSKHPFIMPTKKTEEAVADDIKEIIIPESMTIKDFAAKIKLQPSAIVKKLFLKGQIVTLNTELSFEQLEEIALEYDIICTLEEKVDVIAELLKEDEESEELMVKRPPVVCVMGHVDHGKTSLLDAIRSANVTVHEAGGITQHIGAYMVKINGEPITFLDTPGHEAFTAMRMRGAMSTDIAILVVAADDGVMPQTVEAINHAKAAGVEIIVAVNKIDKPSANIDRVKQELSEHELIPEDWGGSTIFCPVSAKSREGIENLLEMIILAAEVKELKANKKRKARGLVIEAELDKGRGPVATILVQKGTLKVGDFVAAGACHGKVRAMINDKGQRVKEATPSTPVEILGLNNVPNAGEVLVATASDKEARDFAETFISENKNKLIEDTKAKLSLDDLFTQIKAGNIKELPIIIKADVQGSVEAVKQSLTKLSNEEVAVKVIHGGVGAINESDVSLAAASNAIIIGFNVRPDSTAKVTAEREKVDLRLYKIIYQAIEDVQAAMNGMLEPIYEEKVIGHAEIRQIFKASGIGSIAGSYVLDGKFVRSCKVRITREGELIFDGNLASLKRFKDDVKEVKEGYECGLVFEKFNDIQEFDQVEAYDMVEVPRK
jgi:translation initiation factor IF-2